MGFHNDKDELELFKRYDLNKLLPQLGWSEDETARNRGKDSKVFTLAGDTVVTFKLKNGVWLAKNHGTGKSHTVIDFANGYTGNFGKTRQLLRQLTSQPIPVISSSTRPPSAQPPAPEKQCKTSSEVLTEYQTASREWKTGFRLPDFLKDRGIHRLPPQFDKSFRVSSQTYENVLFPYQRMTESGIEMCGVERKNHGFKGYTEDGRAGFWLALDEDGGEYKTFTVCENPIDCMSFELMSSEAQVEREARGRLMNYLALRSGSEADVVKLLELFYERRGTERVYLAVDNDAAGAAYAMKIMGGLRNCKNLDVKMVMPPLDSDDWNEAHMKRLAQANRQHPAENDGLELSM